MTCVEETYKAVHDTSGFCWQGGQHGSQQPKSVCHTERRSFRERPQWHRIKDQHKQSLDKQRRIQKDGTLPAFLGTLGETAFTAWIVSFCFLNLEQIPIFVANWKTMSAHGNIKTCYNGLQIRFNLFIQISIAKQAINNSLSKSGVLAWSSKANWTD